METLTGLFSFSRQKVYKVNRLRLWDRQLQPEIWLEFVTIAKSKSSLINTSFYTTYRLSPLVEHKSPLIHRTFLIGSAVDSPPPLPLLLLLDWDVCLPKGFTLCSIISPWSAMRHASLSGDSFLIWINTSSKPIDAISSLERGKESECNYQLFLNLKKVHLLINLRARPPNEFHERLTFKTNFNTFILN